MEKVRIEEAVGMVLGHDVTQIIPGQFKGPRFKRGHLIREEDIPEFLKIGKEHVYVMDVKAGAIHEDDAALRLGKAFSGENIDLTVPSEGKVTFYSKIKGILKINLPLFTALIYQEISFFQHFIDTLPVHQEWLSGQHGLSP